MRNLISETAEKVSDNIVSMKYSNKIPPEKQVSDLVSIDWRNVLPEPPENNSQITREEIKEVSDLCNKRTDRQEELVRVVDKDIRVMFERLLKDNNLSYPAEKIKKL